LIRCAPSRCGNGRDNPCRQRHPGTAPGVRPRRTADQRSVTPPGTFRDFARRHRTERDGQKDLLRGIGARLEVEAQRAGGIAEAVAHPAVRRQAAAGEVIGDRPLVERRCAESVGRAQRDHRLRAIHPHHAVAVVEFAHRADAAEVLERLPTRRDLQRAHGAEQGDRARRAQGLDAVADVEHDTTGRTGGEGGGREPQVAVTPHGGRQRQAIPLQALGDGGVGPGKQ
jgi:hypothetical protein